MFNNLLIRLIEYSITFVTTEHIHDIAQSKTNN